MCVCVCVYIYLWKHLHKNMITTMVPKRYKSLKNTIIMNTLSPFLELSCGAFNHPTEFCPVGWSCEIHRLYHFENSKANSVSIQGIIQNCIR